MFTPETDRDLVDEIMRRPGAEGIATEVQERLLRERERRAAFYDRLDEDKS